MPHHLKVSQENMPSLVDRANDFIASGHTMELRPLLLECVNVNNPEGLAAVQALARDMYGGITVIGRFQDAAQVFPNFSIPQGLVVNGLEGGLTDLQQAALQRENQHRSQVTIMGYDALGLRARSVTQNVVENPIFVTTTRL